MTKTLCECKIKAVIFDMDGVLIDSEPPYRVAEEAMLKSLGLPFGPEQIVAMTGGSYRELGGVLRGWNPDLTASDDQIRHMYLSGLLGALREHVNSLVDGVSEFMEELRARGVKMAIGSASHRDMVELVAERFALAPYLSAVVTGSDAERGKPAPDIFLMCAERMDAAPGECLVIEDSVNGLNAALNAGMPCAAFLGTAHHPFDLSGASFGVGSFGPEDRAVLWRFIESGGTS